MTTKLPNLLSLLLLLATIGSSGGQTATDPNEGFRISRDHSTGTISARWFARDAYYYQLQQTQELGSDEWIIFPYAVKGQDGIEGVDIEAAGLSQLFLRLKFSNDPNADFLLEDWDGDGVSNVFEMDYGTDPFDASDLDANGIPDDVETIWALLENAWNTLAASDPNAAFYDAQALGPLEDYDGDGRSNFLEMLEGTSPIDFFNGETANLYVVSGDGQTGAPGRFLGLNLRVLVQSEDGHRIDHAPVCFEVVGGGNHLAPYNNTDLLVPALYTRSTGELGASAAFYTPSTVGETLVRASLPTGASVTFTVHTVNASSAAKAPISNFRTVKNADGTTTYTWVSQADPGDWFQIEHRLPDGSWGMLYGGTYGSQDLPYVSGRTDYSLTLDENFSPVP